MKRFPGSKTFPLGDALYDLAADPAEKRNLIDQPGHAGVAQALSERIDAYFQGIAVEKYDLWRGGSTKSNTDKPWLWEDAWGEEWEPVFG